MKVLLKIIIYFLILYIPALKVSSQEGIVTGRISDSEGIPLFPVNISIKYQQTGTMSTRDGSYELRVPAGQSLILVYSYVGFTSQEREIYVQPGEKLLFHITMEPEAFEIGEVSIGARSERAASMIRLNLKPLQMVPGPAGAVETLIKTLPGVSSSNELSSQYSVRGGNFDENMVYVNGIEIYRPFLVRSGQQEGLSFVNSDLVSSVRFSAGGFEAHYGDRMSSVLDITYKKPLTNQGSFSGSLLGGSIHYEGADKSGKFTHLTGLRYKSNSYLLNSLDTEGDYKPKFLDLQTLLTYSVSPKTELSFLGNISGNRYNFTPETRRTNFGTASIPLNLVIYFEGNEKDIYNVYQGAISLVHNPQKNLTLTFITSGFNSYEAETYDILGEYLINELDNTIGSDTYGDSILNIGVGGFLNHARNYLNAYVLSSSHTGEYTTGRHRLKWGARFQKQMISDKLSEWEMIDSAGFSIPQDPEKIQVYKLIKANNTLKSGNISGFLQDTWQFNDRSNSYFLIAGLRATYLDLTHEFFLSPRISFSMIPGWERDVMFKVSAGLYYQPPFYKEMRNLEGEMNQDLLSQQSAHLVAGGDYIFRAWGRPFKFSAEMYYKDLNKLVPYKLDNVNIRYAGDNLAKGYATGIDMKLNGEFVKNAESWLSISLMRTREDIKDDYYFKEIYGETIKIEPGYYPRPTDQLFSAGLFFQDYFPNNPDYKVHLNLLYGSRLPYSSPKEDRYDELYRLPPYRRVDIGFSKIIKQFDREHSPDKPAGFIRNMWISAEIFNLLGMNNTISYFWVRTISNQENVPGMFAVPNYLTARRFNFKLSANF